MAVALTSSNLKKLEQENNDFQAYLKKWPDLLKKIESDLKSNVGTTFRNEYQKGKTACEQIQQIVDIFQKEQNELEKLSKSLNTYIAAQKKLNQ